MPREIDHYTVSKVAEEWFQYLKHIEKPRDGVATIDFETRSTADLKKVGPWVYSKYPTTEVMCLAYKLPGDEDVTLWHRSHGEYGIEESPVPEDLLAFILGGGLIEAHNAFFERCIWKNIMVPKYEWAEIGHKQWRCSAAKAAAFNLPRDLGGASIALNITNKKDDEGHKLMLKMCKPRKPLKAEKDDLKAKNVLRIEEGLAPEEMPTLWHENEEDIRRQWEYCGRDVKAEEELSDHVPDLSPFELRVWQMDQAMNERGIIIDQSLANACIKMADEAKGAMNKELELMTGISSGTQRAKIKQWLEDEEALELPDTAAPTLDWYSENVDMSGRAESVLRIIKLVNRTSIRKFHKMLMCVDRDDSRVRDILMYCAAGTGRWGGRGIQVQNLPGGNLGDLKTNMDEAVDDIMAGDIDYVKMMYGDPMELISSVSRGAITAASGREIMVADYSAIEARVVLWLADDTSALQVFRDGEDIYCDMASGIYGYEVKKATHKAERSFGKQAVLGLGYSMGFLTFLLTCRKFGIKFSKAEVLRIMGAQQMGYYMAKVRDFLCMDGKPENMTQDEAAKWANKVRQASKARRQLTDAREVPNKVVHELALMMYTVKVYRDRYSSVKEMWKANEDAAIEAIRIRDKIVELESGGEWDPFDELYDQARVVCGKVTWFVDRELDVLRCELPSKRFLTYHNPELKSTRTAWGQVKPSIRFMAVDSLTRKWTRQHTYGGKLCLAGRTLVLTDRGWIELHFVTHEDKVWDGNIFVSQDGLLDKGYAETIDLNGVRMTPDHEVLTEEGEWRSASSCGGYHGFKVRLPNSNEVYRVQRKEVHMGVRMLWLWWQGKHASFRVQKADQEGSDSLLRVPEKENNRREEYNSWVLTPPSVLGVEGYEAAVRKPKPQGLQKLWGAWHKSVRKVAKEFQWFLGRHAGRILQRVNHRKKGQRGRVLERELYMGYTKGTVTEQKIKQIDIHSMGGGNGIGSKREVGHWGYDHIIPTEQRGKVFRIIQGPGCEEQVYDLMNCGPLNRFTVMGISGPMIVHNCENITQAVARDLMAFAMLRIDRHATYDIMMSVHDEVVCEVNEGAGDIREFEELMEGLPDWAEGCPVAAEGDRFFRYRK